MKDPVNRDFDEIGQEALRVLLVVADGEMLLSLTGKVMVAGLLMRLAYGVCSRDATCGPNWP